MSLRSDSAEVRVRFLDPLIFYSLLALIALTAIAYGTVQPWWIAAFECGVFLIAGLAVVDAAINKKTPLRILPVLPLLAPFCLLWFSRSRYSERQDLSTR